MNQTCFLPSKGLQPSKMDRWKHSELRVGWGRTGMLHRVLRAQAFCTLHPNHHLDTPQTSLMQCVHNWIYQPFQTCFPSFVPHAGLPHCNAEAWDLFSLMSSTFSIPPISSPLPPPSPWNPSVPLHSHWPRPLPVTARVDPWPVSATFSHAHPAFHSPVKGRLREKEREEGRESGRKKERKGRKEKIKPA